MIRDAVLKRALLLTTLLASLATVPLPAQAEGATGLAGRYRLQADDRLISHNLDLEFFRDSEAAANPNDSALPESKSGLWSARVVALPDPETPRLCSVCPRAFAGRPLLNLKILQGLRERDDGEFLYGRLTLPGQSRELRCKVWRRAGNLYLRIYEKHRYTTHRLNALP